MQSDLEELLREHGVQVTAQRLAVLQAVAYRPHCTAENVAEAVRARIGAISQQAVYDALGLLTEKGLMRRIHVSGSAALYERQVGDNHHHLICRVCGETTDVECVVDEAPCLTGATKSGHRIDEAEVIYRGTCRECLSETAGAGD